MATAYDKNVYIPLEPIIGEVVGRGKNGDDLYQLPAASIKKLNDTLWSIVKKVQGNINLSDLDSLAVDELRANVVISNTVITNNLYATYGDIAELTTDRLLSADKVARYWASDTSDINYISIQGEYIKFITGSTTGSTTQHTDRDSNLLYYNGEVTAETYKTVGMSTTVTAYPVTVYSYTEQIKASIAFIEDGEYYTPVITLGAGSGTGDYGKGFIYKDTDGLVNKYLHSTTGAEQIIKATDDGISVSGNTGTGMNLRNIGFGSTLPTSGYQDYDLFVLTT